MQQYLLATLVVANFALACESGNTTAPTDDATNVAPDVEVLHDAAGPTKPEPVQLGTYSVLWANWTPPDESTIGMFNDDGEVAYVTYQSAFENEPATYSLSGDMPELTCSVGNGDELTCPAWTAQDGTIVTATGKFTEDGANAVLYVDFLLYSGQDNERHKYLVFHLVRK